MSSTFSAVSAASVLDSKEPGCELSDSVRSTHSVGGCSLDAGPESLSTPTSATSPAGTPGDQLTLFAVDSLAKTSPGRAVGRRGFLGNAPASGMSTPVLLANFDPDTQSWRTQQHSLVEGLATYSGAWPRSGTTLNGTASALPTLVLPTRENVFGWWPTPRASDRDNCGGSGARSKAKQHGTYIGRQMNPQVSEWLLGFPTGWTELLRSVTRSCRRSRKSSAAQSLTPRGTDD